MATWAEENLPAGFTVFALSEAHRRKMRTSNSCENLNTQIQRRTRVVGIFPVRSPLSDSSPGCSSRFPETGKQEKSPSKTNKADPKLTPKTKSISTFSKRP
ncbi:transposase [Roseibacillus ishigakijimensis]|uniref:Transposase n=1 Tax=Roseibacillus ishigakijimensis TaxID=454146 RepID=A0A934RRA4_9BACT|nr:transposase [Roseibacillus ishigakijimensis]